MCRRTRWPGQNLGDVLEHVDLAVEGTAVDEVEGDARWELLIALVQVAVGYHKCASGHPGDRVMLEKGLAKLEPFADDAGGVALGALRTRVRNDLAALGAGTPPAIVLANPPRLMLAPSADWSS